MRKLNRLLFFTLLFFVLMIFRNWFSLNPLSSGDWDFRFNESIEDITFFPFSWNFNLNAGLGGMSFFTLSLSSYYLFTTSFLFKLFKMPWPLTERFVWFWPFLITTIFSSFYLYKYLFSNKFALLASFIYLFNTYILMVVGGGQMGVALAYSIAPFVLASFIELTNILISNHTNVRFKAKIERVIIILGLSFGLQLFLDPRFAYVTFFAILAYLALVFLGKNLDIVKSLIIGINLLFVFFISFLPNAFWIFPLFFFNSSFDQLDPVYTSSQALNFFSFADFSHALSLLHPNWPENLFGKTYFLQPEFLLLPILAFVSMIFVDHKVGSKHLVASSKGETDYPNYQLSATSHQGLTVSYFAFLGLLGAFLAKGINPPFGAVYTWLFEHVPGFIMFRDPTKWYALIAISYSILIPFTLSEISSRFRVKVSKFNLISYQLLLIVFFLFFWFFTVRQAVFGQLGGTFKVHNVPQEYIKLKDILVQQPEFFRTLWVPAKQRFGFASERHPLIDARDVFKTSNLDAIIAALTDPAAEHLIRSFSVKYIVVPDDSMGEIFLTDRSYDPALRERVVQALDAVPYIRRLPQFTGLRVYEYAKPAGHFYRVVENLDMERQEEQRVRSTLYTVHINTSLRPVTLVFSEGFDPAWKLWDGKTFIQSRRTAEGLNSFVIDSNHTSRVSIWYSKELVLVWAYRGTGIALSALLLFFVMRNKRMRKAMGKGIVAAILAGAMMGAYRFLIQETDVLQSSAVRYSPEWLRVTHPVTGERVVSSRFGGSEASFRLKHASMMHVEADSMNAVPDEQMLKLYVGNAVYTLVSPFRNKRLDIALPQGELVSVTVQVICSSALVPCDVRVKTLSANRGSIVMPPTGQQYPVMAILGDSITSSFGPNNYSYMLAKQLGYRVQNAGIFGSTVSSVAGWDSALQRVSTDITAFKPDVALLFVGTNDLAHKVPIHVFRSKYAAALTRIQQESPSTRIVAVGLLRRKDVSEQEVRLYSGAIRAEAQVRNIPYVDPYAWLDSDDLQDAVHPSPASQEKIAQRLAEALKPLLIKN